MADSDTVIRYAARSDTGRVRDHNEDNFIADPELGLWLVADGMGGHACGEVASQIAVDVIPRQVRAGRSLGQAAQIAHEAILQAVEDDPRRHGMGTTLVAVQFHDTEYTVAWVGDSRAYLYDENASPALKQISRDHSFVQMLLDVGGITEEEAENHPNKNVITQNLGDPQTEQLSVDTVQSVLTDKQKLLLCSDGLSDEVSDELMATIMSQHDDVEKLNEVLIQTAIDNGGADNVTVILLSLG